MLELFSFPPRRWGEGGPVGGYRVVVDNSGTILCIPAEDFQLAVTKQHNLFQSTEYLPALEDFAQKITPRRREMRSHPAALVNQLLYAHPRQIFSTHILEA
jgi:hypothetical protein